MSQNNQISLEEEYQVMELQYPTDTLEDVVALIEYFQDTIEESRINSLKIMKQYYRRTFFASFFYLWQKLTDSVEDIDYYQEEIRLLQQEVDLSLEFQELQMRLLQSLDENTLETVAKMSQFTDQYYEYNFCYYENKRDQLYYQQQGIGMIPNTEGARHNIEEFKDFFEKTLSKNNLGKGIEKVKRI